MGRLADKVAVITGGTRGFGLALAQAFIREGAAVVIGSRSAAAVDQAIAGLKTDGVRVDGLACNVGDRLQVQALADRAIASFGQFDIWINNAGISGTYGPTIDLQPEKFEQVVQTNIMGTYYGSQVAMSHFLMRGHGKLINVLGAGARQPTPYQNAYASSKAWIRNFTIALAKEYKDSGVEVFPFQPGLMTTELLSEVEVIEGHAARLKVFPAIIRMWGRPPEVAAQKVVWLAGSATDGKSSLEATMLTRGAMLGGGLHELWRRVTRQPLDEMKLNLKIVPSALKKN